MKFNVLQSLHEFNFEENNAKAPKLVGKLQIIEDFTEHYIL